jgi:hypothetical protein
MVEVRLDCRRNKKGGRGYSLDPPPIMSAWAVHLESVYMPDNTPLVLSQTYELLYNEFVVTE